MKGTLPVTTPEFNRPVRAIVKKFDFTDVQICFLTAVDESDHTWEFLDDGGELSNAYDVVYWEYLEDV